jgi:hypothetical protein
MEAIYRAQRHPLYSKGVTGVFLFNILFSKLMKLSFLQLGPVLRASPAPTSGAKKKSSTLAGTPISGPLFYSRHHHMCLSPPPVPHAALLSSMPPSKLFSMAVDYNCNNSSLYSGSSSLCSLLSSSSTDFCSSSSPGFDADLRRDHGEAARCAVGAGGPTRGRRTPSSPRRGGS